MFDSFIDKDHKISNSPYSNPLPLPSRFPTANYRVVKVRRALGGVWLWPMGTLMPDRVCTCTCPDTNGMCP